MRILAPIKAPFNVLDPSQVVNSPPWLEWFQRVSDYYTSIAQWIDAGSRTDFGAHAPADPTEGMLAYADGINWDPGSGVGYYRYENGVWVSLGGGGFSDTVVSEILFGQTPVAGTARVIARGDHTHGTPTDPVPAHVAAADPHTQYQKESEKGVANGYASLDAGVLVPLAQFATGTPDGTVENRKFLADDRALIKPRYFQVGSLYGTLDYTNPATILGYGTWELISIT